MGVNSRLHFNPVMFDWDAFVLAGRSQWTDGSV